MSGYSIETLLKNLRNLKRTKRFDIHKLELFTSDINYIIRGLELLVEKENLLGGEDTI
jgi:hypothetical protein